MSACHSFWSVLPPSPCTALAMHICKHAHTARALQGRPAAGSELTSDYNPLEAGLWGAVSIDKGCYIGERGGWCMCVWGGGTVHGVACAPGPFMACSMLASSRAPRAQIRNR